MGSKRSDRHHHYRKKRASLLARWRDQLRDEAPMFYVRMAVTTAALNLGTISDEEFEAAWENVVIPVLGKPPFEVSRKERRELFRQPAEEPRFVRRYEQSVEDGSIFREMEVLPKRR